MEEHVVHSGQSPMPARAGEQHHVIVVHTIRDHHCPSRIKSGRRVNVKNLYYLSGITFGALSFFGLNEPLVDFAARILGFLI
ncbi:hypothetical protein ACIQ7S_13420 [Streptomyces griseoluteus]|uniref:hypothetical protein n=1 Tax=Streptomyces griseoluteus TaxID=29306 RepID=UPI003327EA4C